MWLLASALLTATMKIPRGPGGTRPLIVIAKCLSEILLVGLDDRAYAYCNRGSSYPREKHDLAISDLNRAIQIRGASDPCECEPYNPLLAIYLQTGEYDKAREVAALAQRSRKWIAPEFLEQLKAASAVR